MAFLMRFLILKNYRINRMKMGNYDAAKLKAELTRDEDRRNRIYVGTVGKVFAVVVDAQSRAAAGDGMLPRSRSDCSSPPRLRMGFNSSRPGEPECSRRTFQFRNEADGWKYSMRGWLATANRPRTLDALRAAIDVDSCMSNARCIKAETLSFARRAHP
ncbi:hypothetical protein [Burkholderia stagnalis]|uniref:hypothetical protein n=1 Tax=Burkholderia stagnalis TaxID=1503054 RepID=UPI003D767D0C